MIRRRAHPIRFSSIKQFNICSGQQVYQDVLTGSRRPSSYAVAVAAKPSVGDESLMRHVLQAAADLSTRPSIPCPERFARVPGKTGLNRYIDTTLLDRALEQSTPAPADGRMVNRESYLIFKRGKIPFLYRNDHTSMDAFRKILLFSPNAFLIRDAIRWQFLQCQSPRQILRIIAAIIQHRPHDVLPFVAHEALARALYRCRPNYHDEQVLRTLHIIITRFHIAGIALDQKMYELALKFAARTRNLEHMKKYLRIFKDKGFVMSSNVFRAIIAKCSIGTRGLGEIRNGRWRRSELVQVLLGFDDCQHLPPDQQFHLGAFVDREDWEFWHGFIAILGKCRHHEAISREWALWQSSKLRLYPRPLKKIKATHLTTKSRGDYWFLEQMCITGALDKAWDMFRGLEYEFKDLRSYAKDGLAGGVEFAGDAWNEDVRQAVLDKYDRELGRIERALGVTWVSTDPSDDAQGHHVMVDNQEDVLDRLGADDWKFEEDFGFPHDLLPPGEERNLHAAPPTKLAEHSDERGTSV